MRIIACLLLSCAITHGQTVAISGPAGSYSTISTLPSPGIVALPLPWSGPAGVYQITLPSGAMFSQSGNSLTITWGDGPSPPLPPPSPGPTPPLPVTPQTTALFVVAVYDRVGPTVPNIQAALQTSTTIAPALKAYNASWASVDVTTPTAQAWVVDAKKAGIPALLVITTDAKNKAGAFEAIPLPKDGEPGVINEVKRIRGVGSDVVPAPQMGKLDPVKLGQIRELLVDVKTTLGRKR